MNANVLKGRFNFLANKLFHQYHYEVYEKGGLIRK